MAHEPRIIRDISGDGYIVETRDGWQRDDGTALSLADVLGACDSAEEARSRQRRLRKEARTDPALEGALKDAERDADVEQHATVQRRHDVVDAHVRVYEAARAARRHQLANRLLAELADAAKLVDSGFVAEETGLARQSILNYLGRGMLPRPAHQLGGSPLWTVDQYTGWYENRPGSGWRAGQPGEVRNSILREQAAYQAGYEAAVRKAAQAEYISVPLGAEP